MTNTLDILFKKSTMTFMSDASIIFAAKTLDGENLELMITRTLSDSGAEERTEYLKMYNTYILTDSLERSSESLKEVIATILEMAYPHEIKAGFTETIAPDLSIKWDQLHVSHFAKYSTTAIHGIGV